MFRIATYIALILLLTQSASGQVVEHPAMQAGDTLYKSWDLLPQNVELAPAGEGSFWDLSGLLAPYVHEIYVRPVPARQELSVAAEMAYVDAFDVERFLVTERGTTYIAAYRLSLLGRPRILGKCDPPIPWSTTETREGAAWTYSGTVTFQLHSGVSITPDIAVNDSVRITVDVEISGEIAGAGEVLTPTGLYDVHYKREDVITSATMEVYRNGTWKPVNRTVPMDFPRDLATGRMHTFISAMYPDPVAVVYADIFDNLSSVEFRSSPRTGRVVRSSPKVPDVFVYPNPSFGQVRFDFVNLEPGFYQIEVYNILGVKVRTEDLYINGTRTVPMDLTDLKKGTYIYRLVDAQKNALRSKRLVIITP